MTRKDWTLLAIAAARGDALDPAQLQKALFLLGKECPWSVVADFYAFKPYHYGPFDADIYRDAEELEEDGLVAIDRSGSLRRYCATAKGMAHSEVLSRTAPPGAVDYLSSVVQWARALSFQALVRAIYARYPDQRQNSVFAD